MSGGFFDQKRSSLASHHHTGLPTNAEIGKKGVWVFHSPGATSGGFEGFLAADEQVIVVVEDDGVNVTRLRNLLE